MFVVCFNVTTLTGVGRCSVASGAELVIMLISSVTQRQCACFFLIDTHSRRFSASSESTLKVWVHVCVLHARVAVRETFMVKMQEQSGDCLTRSCDLHLIMESHHS